MINHKIFYKIVLVLGLLITMILTLSLTEYSIAYAEEVQPPTAETGDNTENNRFDFDSSLLEKAREIIGSDVNLNATQIEELHAIGFNDKQITLLVEIVHDDTSIDIDKESPSSLPAFVCSALFIILLLGLIFSQKHKRVIS